MSTYIRQGEKLHAQTLGEIEIVKHLGSGAQGEVFEVATSAGPKALKWYFPSMATSDQLTNLRYIVQQELRDPRLLWPEALVERESDFGYVMRIRPSDYEILSKIIKGRVAIDLQQLLRAAIGLVGAYRAIHVAGLAYRDIKDPNVFVRTSDGAVLICDNDNAVPSASPSQMKGTTDFCAPELLVGGANPNSLSDLHSLAVLLFMMLVRGHPLDGTREDDIHCLNDEARLQLYGSQPIFVYDPNDARNRPAARHGQVTRHWPIWPADLRDLWTRAFGEGLRSPKARPTLLEWMDVLGRAQDSLRRCQHCSMRTVAPTTTAADWTCWNCGSSVAPGPRCRIYERTVFLDPGAAIFEHHLNNKRSNADYEQARFTAVVNPHDPSMIGLRNDTATAVSYLRPDGSAVQIEPGRSARVVDGAQLITSQTTIRFRA